MARRGFSFLLKSPPISIYFSGHLIVVGKLPLNGKDYSALHDIHLQLTIPGYGDN